MQKGGEAALDGLSKVGSAERHHLQKVECNALHCFSAARAG
jgi:hypothetical protein